MALQSCAECGAQVSSKAAACPSCGVKLKKSSHFMMYSIGGVFILGVIGSTINKANETPRHPAAPLTAEQQSAEKKNEVEKIERFNNTVSTLRGVKDGLRDPRSVEWVDVGSNHDGSVVCVTYRARNGFGGMNVEQVAMVKDTISNSRSAWNRNCAGKTLYEVKDALHAVE